MEGQRRIIASLDETAERAGLERGMTVTHAQSLLPDLTVLEARPEEDEAALNRLAIWCLRYSPLVTADPPDGVFIDVAGAAHLFQGEEALMRDLLQRVHAGHVVARAAIADTPGCAWALARYSDVTLASPGRATEVLASLPIAALRLSATTVSGLHEVGIERVAQLATKPRAGLRLRFGGEVLLRFDQAMGSIPEALTSLLPPEVPFAEKRYPEPLGDPEDLKRVIAVLCEELCETLERRGIGARRLDLVFLRVDNIAQAVRVGLSRPSRDTKHLAALLNERLVLVDPGLGIEVATLTASWVEALSERQTLGRHVGGEDMTPDVGRLVDALGVRLGQGNVFRMTPVESALPERATKPVAALALPRGVIWPKNLPRPARLFAHPEKIEAIAELPDQPPRFFMWRQVRHRVTKADGPERIHGEWWVSDAEMTLIRDYYRVETMDGARYWLFRIAEGGVNPEQNGSWWLHGVGEA